VLTAGDTVEMRLGHPTIPHLWILVTDPHPDSQKAVIVSVTTLRSHSDQTVILRKGDHPYILHDSVVSYQDAQELSVVKIQAQIDRGWPQCDSCSDELLRKVQAGLLTSRFTKKSIKVICQQAWEREGKT
jgi:hypothetical protein